MIQYFSKKDKNLGIKINLFLKKSIIKFIIKKTIKINNGIERIFDKKASINSKEII